MVDILSSRISILISRFSLSLFLLLLSVLTAYPAEQFAGMVEAEGYAAIVAGNKGGAREAALQNAFRRAVEQVVGVAIESKSVVSDSELLNDKVFAKSSGFIKTYRIISEKAEPDAYRVTVQASVSRYRLEQGLDDAGLLLRKLGRPRIAVVVMEQHEGANAVPGGVVENQIINSLAAGNFALVDRQAMLAVEKAAATGTGDYTDAVVRAAAAGGAEVVIVGQATARSAAALRDTNLRPVQVMVTCKAIEVDSGELLATVTSSEQSLNVNQGVAANDSFIKASKELSGKLQQQILAAWNKRLTGLRVLRLAVQGIPHQATLRFKEGLREQLGQVEEVHDRGFRDNRLRLDLEVTGDTKGLVEQLSAFRLEKSTLEITGYSAGQIQAKWHGGGVKGGRVK